MFRELTMNMEQSLSALCTGPLLSVEEGGPLQNMEDREPLLRVEGRGLLLCMEKGGSLEDGGWGPLLSMEDEC